MSVRFTPFIGKHLQAVQLQGPSINAFEGAVASGKTIVTLLLWVAFIRKAPKGVRHALVGKTERTVINNLILPLQEIFGTRRIVINYGKGTVQIFGVEVLVFGAANAQAVTKIQGLTLYSAYVDEAANVPENFFSMLYTRLRVPGARMWLTCNPEGPRHWLKVHWLDRYALWVDIHGTVHTQDAAKDGAIRLHRFTFNIDDNAHNLPDDYVEDTKKAYSGVFYQRMILCQWVAAEGIIYDAFKRERHVIPAHRIPAEAYGLADGGDYGTTNPTRFYAMRVGPDLEGKEGNSLYITREWAPPTGQTDGDYSAGYRAHREADPTPGRFVYVDPAAKSLRLQMARDGIRTIKPASNDVLAGIRTVASLLAAGRLYIADDCPELLKEIEGYVWDPAATAKGADRPLKINDHSMDALRYVVYSSFKLWRNLIPVNPAAATIVEEDEDYAA